MSLRLLLCAAALAAACAGPSASPAPAPAHPATHAARTPSPPPMGQYFDDMMGGGVPAATVFVVSGREVLAVALLNHFARYRIPVGDNPQLAVLPLGLRLYVADEFNGQLRLRWFDVDSGFERASRSLPSDAETAGRLPRTASARGAIGLGPGGQLLVMREQTLPWARGVVVHAYDEFTLRDLGAVFKKRGCADQLLASGARIAVACLSHPEFAVDEAPSGYVSGDAAKGGLAGAAMASDGTIVAAYPNGEVFGIGARSAELRRLNSFAAGGSIVSDGVGMADGDRVLIAQRGAKPFMRVTDLRAQTGGMVFTLPNAPASGILAFGRFAYWVDGGADGVYHVDLQTGLVERMIGPLDKGARLGALAAR